jgi:NADH dehydrogenase
MKNIVVVGGGAGGLEFVTQLAEVLKKNDDVSITLIDKLAAHMWKPLLHEVALGTLNIEQEQTNYFLHAKKHGYRFIQAELFSIDRESKTIQIKTQHRTESNELVSRTEQRAYDVLVLALGAKSNDFGTPGVREHCYFLDDIEQAQKIHQDMMLAYQNSQQLHMNL